MRVRKTSWHYRLWMLGRQDHSRPRDLCRYFWHLMLIKILAPLILASMVLLGVGSLAYVIWGHPVETSLVLLSALVLAAIVVGIILFVRWQVSRHAVRRLDAEPKLQRPKKQKEPSPFWEYLKARKRKVCPLIQVIDEETGS